MTTAASTSFRITGRHVLVAFVLFFGVIIGVDALMITAAYRTFSGQVASNPYEAGLAFNRTLAQRRAEADLGWRMSASRTSDHRIELRVVDRAGAPLEALSVTGDLERPATDKGRIALQLLPVAPGVFRSQVVDEAGAWDLTASASDAWGRRIEAEERFLWP